MFSKFFIDRPRFAIVVCVLMAFAGVIAAFSLPIEQYPNVTPPQIQVTTTYRGADAVTLANTVGAPLEEMVNGVEDMIYMNSSSSNNGEYKLTVTFATGTDPDMALVRVQNRVSQVTPQLPAEVVAEGVTVETAFSDILAFLAIISPNGTHSELDLSNYAHANIKNVLKRVPGMGDVQVYGSKYSIRIWLDPVRIAWALYRRRGGGHREPEQTGLHRLRRRDAQRDGQPHSLHLDDQGAAHGYQRF